MRKMDSWTHVKAITTARREVVSGWRLTKNMMSYCSIEATICRRQSKKRRLDDMISVIPTSLDTGLPEELCL